MARPPSLCSACSVFVAVLGIAAGCGGKLELRDADAEGGTPNVDAGSSTDGAESTPERDAGTGRCGPLADCPSFAVDIFVPMFSATGRYGCASTACHGVATRPAPMMDAKTTLALLERTFVFGSALPYVSTTSCAPSQSAIACNLLPLYDNNACGMHMPTGHSGPSGVPEVSATDLATITHWLACGALP
jgi:hypothetical protein